LEGKIAINNGDHKNLLLLMHVVEKQRCLPGLTQTFPDDLVPADFFGKLKLLPGGAGKCNFGPIFLHEDATHSEALYCVFNKLNEVFKQPGFGFLRVLAQKKNISRISREMLNVPITALLRRTEGKAPILFSSVLSLSLSLLSLLSLSLSLSPLSLLSLSLSLLSLSLDSL